MEAAVEILQNTRVFPAGSYFLGLQCILRLLASPTYFQEALILSSLQHWTSIEKTYRCTIADRVRVVDITTGDDHKSRHIRVLNGFYQYFEHHPPPTNEPLAQHIRTLSRNLTQGGRADLLYTMLADLGGDTSPKAKAMAVLNTVFTQVVRKHLMGQQNPHELYDLVQNSFIRPILSKTTWSQALMEAQPSESIASPSVSVTEPSAPDPATSPEGNSPTEQTWMRCRLEAHGSTINAIADTGSEGNVISKTLATSLELEVHPPKGILEVVGKKTVPTCGTVNLEIRHKDFCARIEAIVVDQHDELLLGRPFWKTYRVVPDYVQGGVIVHENEKQWHLGTVSPPMLSGDQKQAATRKEQAKPVTDSTKSSKKRTPTSPELTTSTGPSYLGPTQSSTAKSQAVKHEDTRASPLSRSSAHRSADSAGGRSPSRETAAHCQE